MLRHFWKILKKTKIKQVDIGLFKKEFQEIKTNHKIKQKV